MAERIVVVEDDPSLARTLGITLRARGYDVEAVATGRAALAAHAARGADLVLLDLGLPDLDGVTVLERLRRTSQVPVVVLSARREADDKVAALDAGADDYVTKPFGPEELMARVRAALRRGHPTAGLGGPDDAATGSPGGPVPAGPHGAALPGRVTTADFTLDFAAYEARVRGSGIRLTPTEWRLLAELARHGGQVVPHADLLRAAWGPAYGRESNYLRVYANQLRRKLEPEPREPRYLVTVPGVGYRLDVPAPTPAPAPAPAPR
ncbi:response regulator transcription factor [Arsenicicoccus sp. oral taxon 190]|uniref:response regulator transcription factor n=1 Tax=Arsenicicoccus sp. oral taxon 190 TaxID=1658671 RepID=UPI00067A1DCD|nr:response regulator transcription factor [Arsenicicoccus sp. oral taxon 190]AKT51245.1 Fis family transcriptional regulator [Arsenicicoccus sp. oral taxon 190]